MSKDSEYLILMSMKSVISALFLAIASTTPSVAQVPENIARAEILEGWRAEDGRHLTALRITLAPGWKTYWRAPGDAGIPPRFDWSGSTNAQRVSLSYPLPNVFEFGGMRSIGYQKEVVFPIAVEPKTAGEPIRLSAELQIGVCEEVCVPLGLSVKGLLPEDAREPAEAVSVAMANRPMSAREAGAGPAECDVAFIEDGLRVTAELEVSPLAREEIAVFEYSDPTVWVSEPTLMRNGNRLTAEVDIVSFGDGAFAFFKDQTRITIFGGGRAVEINGCS